MKELNKQNVPVITRPERIIQFGEGNFLRAFVDWIIRNMNAKADFNSSVVVVQPIEKGMVDMLNKQDNLYHVNLQGLDKGKTVNNLELIDVISRSLNPYTGNAFCHLQYDRSRNHFRPGLPVGGCSGSFLSRQTDPVIIPPL